jgi:hypothetical protein
VRFTASPPWELICRGSIIVLYLCHHRRDHHLHGRHLYLALLVHPLVPHVLVVHLVLTVSFILLCDSKRAYLHHVLLGPLFLLLGSAFTLR